MGEVARGSMVGHLHMTPRTVSIEKDEEIGSPVAPVAGARGQMCHGDRHADLIGQLLQLPLPQPDTDAVAATAVRRDEQALCPRIARLAKFVPSPSNALDGEGCGVMIDPHADPAGIGGDVVDAVGHDLAELRDLEVMHPHLLGIALGPQFPTTVLEVANKLLLLGIHGNRRLLLGLERLDAGIDVLKLGIAVRVMASLTRLVVGLQAEAKPGQQAADQFVADLEAAPAQRFRQMALAPAHPQRRRLRVTAGGRGHQILQCCRQAWLLRRRPLASGTGAAHPSRLVIVPRRQFSQTSADCAPGHAGGHRRRRYAAMARRLRLASRNQSTRALVKKRRQRDKPRADGCNVDHLAMLAPRQAAPHPPS